jgi:teichuronic acid biosynthesis glycosyltransferase TuaG
MSSPAVSIIVPCYNSGRFIRATLEAVRAQTFTDWECIVIDDASSDDSAAIVAAMAEEDPRIVPLRLPENLGAAGARNAGLERVRGDYIAFLDSDDYWVPEKLARQVAYARETGAAMVHSSYRFVDESGQFLPGGVKASDRVDLRSYMRNTEIGMSTSLIDRGKIGAIHFKNIRLCQDTDLWLTLLDRGFVSRGMEEVFVHYRIREGQISGSKIGMAKQVLRLYLGIEQVAFPGRIFYFCCYAANGVLKRLKTPTSS